MQSTSEQREQLRRAGYMIIRNMVGGAEAFLRQLDLLHPGSTARMTTLVELAKVALRLRDYDGQDTGNRANEVRTAQLAAAFSPVELDSQWACFQSLDQLLQADKELYESLFQSGPTRYSFNEMPTGFAVGDFIESWPAIAPAG